MSDLSSVDWSRAQFALTAIYHFLFIPLTLGLSFIIAIMESIYVKTGNRQWRDISKFWLRLFAVNFAIGVATGIIMEFEFGTNWANYSWFAGDIFGAPLAAEGLFAFFLESTFFAVMFFGWDKVSKKFHLISTWLVAIGSNLSAFWILVANGWMQHPVGMTFNPDTARMEMNDFLAVALSPVGVIKFLHTATSGYIISALFVMGISSWFMLKGRHLIMAKKSMIVGASFGLITSLFLIFSGDESGYQVARTQPMKLAAMENLYKGDTRKGIVTFGIVNKDKKPGDNQDPFIVDFEVPYLLSILGSRSIDGFIPGVDDLIFGNKERGIESIESKIQKGKITIDALKTYKEAKSKNDKEQMLKSRKILDENLNYLGYGYLKKPTEAIPNVALTFYSFRIMVGLGTYFIFLFLITLYLCMANNIENFRKLLWICVWSIPLGYIAAEAGWIVAESGRQPWLIQDLLPTKIGATHLSSVNVKISFIMFAVLFTTLLIAEIKIMIKQIKIGFETNA